MGDHLSSAALGIGAFPPIHPIANKLRHALSKGTGVRLTSEQLQRLARCGVLNLIHDIEVVELCREATVRTLSENSGSTSEETEKRQKSGRLPDTTGKDRDPLSTRVLSAGL